ncbi:MULTISPECIES: restriction endonuclease subunit S [unclassified Variovorax]|nr:MULTISPECIES: restriction endonuclease subunit S [unclassified Variovorax]
MKDVDRIQGVVDWRGVIRTRLAGRREPDWLAPEDLLFVARGTRFYASCVGELPGPAVCGPHLFHLRVKPGRNLLPAFLAWHINQAPFQRDLQRAAEGSSQLSVRRPVLESLRIGLPSLADQERIVALARLAQRERQLHDLLIRNRERQFESIAEALASASGNA